MKTTKRTAIARGLEQPKARKTGPTPHYVYRWKPQELAVVATSQA